MASAFLFEIAQAMNILKATRNPHERCDRLQHLVREFVRLQNAYNWSRRVQLDYDKNPLPAAETPRPIIVPPPAAEPKKPMLTTVFKWIRHTKCYRGCICKKCHPEDGEYPYSQALKDEAALKQDVRNPEYWTRGTETWHVMHCACDCPCENEPCHIAEQTIFPGRVNLSPEQRPEPGALSHHGATPQSPRPPTLDPSGFPAPNFQNFQPLPTLATPTPPDPPKPQYRTSAIPIRPRRFFCVEG